MDILVDKTLGAKSLRIAARRKLPSVGSRLPLIRPNGLERPSRRHLKLWVNVVAVAVKPQAKAANSRKKFGYLNHARHLSPLQVHFAKTLTSMRHRS